jgi:hypothetical protein
MTSSERSGDVAAESPEIGRQRRGRGVFCPRCRYPFETMRRFQMACPRCGHAWQEASIPTFTDRIGEPLERAAAGLFWLVGTFSVLIVVGPIIFAIAFLLYWGLTHEVWIFVGFLVLPGRSRRRGDSEAYRDYRPPSPPINWG